MWMRNLPQSHGFEEKIRVGYRIFRCGSLMTEYVYLNVPISFCVKIELVSLSRLEKESIVDVDAKLTSISRV